MKSLVFAAAGFVALVAIGMSLTSMDPTSTTTPAINTTTATTTTTTAAGVTTTAVQDLPQDDIAAPFLVGYDDFFQLSDDICSVAADSADVVEFDNRVLKVFEDNGLNFTQEEMATLTVTSLSIYCEAEGERLFD